MNELTSNTGVGTGNGSDAESWGKASTKRGLANLQLAIDFVTDFPIGTVIDADRLDIWMQRRGLLTVPHENAPKDSDAWKAHLMRRHETRYRINRSGTHPRLRGMGSTPFSLETIQAGLYEVRAPHEAIMSSGVHNKVASLIDTKRKKLAYLMQSADWDQLPPYERLTAETLFDDIDAFSEDIHQKVNRIDMKMARLTARIKQAVEAGVIAPQNHGIQQLLDVSVNAADYEQD